jgi:glycosyltransferase involved in cell wall biosynthesis
MGRALVTAGEAWRRMRMKEHPKFSIVTVCRNAAATIEKTIQSVVSQTYRNIEYIVVDGQSTDATLSVVQDYDRHIARLICERDRGIYDAMNKGIRAATGDVISFLNADDRLFNERSIEYVARFIDTGPGDVDVYHGRVMVFDYEKGDGFVWMSGPISSFLIHREPLPHPAMFCTREAFEKNGLFDPTFTISGDHEWTIRGLKKNHLRFQFMPILVTVFAKGGVSTSRAHVPEAQADTRRAITTHFTPAEDAWQGCRKRVRRKWKKLGRCLFP